MAADIPNLINLADTELVQASDILDMQLLPNPNIDAVQRARDHAAKAVELLDQVLANKL